MEFTFFTMNNFTKEGGGTIRMYGILNELAKQNNKVTLISNAENLSKFETSIVHIPINHCFNAQQKRVLQGLAALLPASLLSLLYKGYLNKLASTVNLNASLNKTIFFFEYLDNTVGYLLKRRGLITSYINDLHGIATLEFKFQADHSSSFKSKAKFLSKYHLSNMLDKKVFNNAYGFIFASKAMQQFYLKMYPHIFNKKSYILPYVLSSQACEQEVDINLRSKLIEELKIKREDVVLLFSGAFKKTGGVPDLLLAVSNLVNDFPNLRVLLVGDGPTMQECQSIVQHKNLQQKVTFIGRTSYADLRTYQDLANIIVCPDKMNMYSELIIHVKYLDALISEKVVINGAFKSVREINKDEFLSVNFDPSDIESLTASIKYCIENLDSLKEKFKNNRRYACDNLTYKTIVKELLN
jgi:glycosyltransferase involved in cell wall biosynthesis